jgi:hypothetical protein
MTMNILNALLVGVLLCGATAASAAGSERPPRLGEQQSASKKAADGQAESPKKPPKRRAVRQMLDDEVRPANGPALQAPGLPPPAITPAPGVPPSPVILNCVGGSCTDRNGGRFNGGVGSSLISPEGKLCNNNGMTVQCF